MSKADMSHPGTTSTKIWGDTYAVRANWAEASGQIEALDADGEWFYTGQQVADFRHSNLAALRANIEAACDRDDLEECEDEIDDAMARAK